MTTHLRITAQLARHAEARVDASGASWLCIELCNPFGNVSLVGRRRMGEGGAAAIAARAAARELRAGTTVTVRCARLEVRAPGLHMVDVERIDAELLYPPRSEPAHREAA